VQLFSVCFIFITELDDWSQSALVQVEARSITE